ncbi:hypothetical protein FW320_24235 [Azospirillum sp. Vi22]|nr:hypothetical protein [Azospirillum baldaniorum]
MPKTRRSNVGRCESKGLTDRFGSSRYVAPTRRTGLRWRSAGRAAVLDEDRGILDIVDTVL